MLQGAVDAVQDRLWVEVVVGARVAGVAVRLLCEAGRAQVSSQPPSRRPVSRS